ncbi:MAG: helix-turn-helix domain-containing protein [Bacteroides sp.]|nr:helix-turn-helix domain-containing protein [Bacteroides sp.]
MNKELVTEESIWTRYKPIVEANKEKRKLLGSFSDNEPPELIIEDYTEDYTLPDGAHVEYPWEMRRLLSNQWVHDLFGEDFPIVGILLSVAEMDMVVVNGNIYYRELYIQNVLNILTVLAKTQFVNQLRPLPQTVKDISKPIYTSKDLMAILNVKESTLRGYRDKLLLDYSKCGDKIWYTQENLMDFLKRTNINNN